MAKTLVRRLSRETKKTLKEYFPELPRRKMKVLTNLMRIGVSFRKAQKIVSDKK